MLLVIINPKHPEKLIALSYLIRNNIFDIVYLWCTIFTIFGMVNTPLVYR